MFDAEVLSRLQFFITIAFHILFPTLNLGLALFIAFNETKYLITKNEFYKTVCLYYTKIFALTFGMGVVSGIVLSYELGTNFGPFTAKFGPVLGALFAYEVLSAFFLEAGFLGIMLFGWQRVGDKLHYFATLMVVIGTTFSAFWILSANSWMQIPSGYSIDKEYVIAKDWLELIFNPTFVLRYIHMMLASYVTTCFVVAGISSYLLLKNKFVSFSQYCLKTALIFACVFTLSQVLVGHTVGIQVHHHQPLKTAAMEGLWNTQKSAPLVLFAYPDQKEQQNFYVLSIPKLASWINTGDIDATLTGLKSVPREDQPLVLPVFYSFRAMVGIGVVLLALAYLGLYFILTKKLFTKKWYLKALLFSAPLGFLATITGWITAECGRQPWIVTGLMRTKESVANVLPSHVLASLIIFVVIYLLIFSFYLLYLFRTIRKGPTETPSETSDSHLFQYMHAEKGN